MALPCVLSPLKRHAPARLASFFASLLCLLPVWSVATSQAIPVVVPGTLGPVSSDTNTCTTNKQCGDGGPLSAATFAGISQMAFDSHGNLYIADGSDQRVRKATKAPGPLSTWIVTSVAGQSQVHCEFTTSPCGDGGPASDPSTRFYSPNGIAFNASDDLFIADFNDNRVRRIDHATGIISTYAGNDKIGFDNPPNIEGLPATQIGLSPWAITVAPDGTLYIVDGFSNGRILSIDPATQTVHVVSLTGISSPQLLAAAPNGDLYIYANSAPTRIFKLSRGTGAVSVVAGGGANSAKQAVRLATDASFTQLSGIATLPSGDLLITDTSALEIYRLEVSSGFLYPIAGCDTGKFCSSTNTTATQAVLNPGPYRLTADPQGNILFFRQVAQQIEEIANTPGSIAFSQTALNTRSNDSPQIAYLMNFGTQPLTLANGTTGAPSTFNPFLTTLTAGADNSFTLDSTVNTANDSVTTPCALPSSNPSPATLAAGATCGFAIGFQPTRTGSVGGSLTLNYSGTNAVGNQQVIPLNSGDATPPALGDSVTVFPVDVTYGDTSASFLAEVFFTPGTAPPTGTPTFSVDGSAPIPATCVVNNSDLTCTAKTYNPSALHAGDHTLTFNIAADSNYAANSGTSTLTVIHTAVFISVGNLTATFDGNPHAVSVQTNPTGVATTVTYNGSTTAPSAVGIYNVAVVPTDNADYFGSATATLTISAATAPTLNFTIPTHTFNDPDFTVVATSNSSGAITYTYVSGPATLRGASVHLTGAGSVSIMASQAANGSFSSETKTATFTVNKAAATVTLGNLAATFDGNPHAATASTTPTGLNVAITYNGSATAPSAAGSYNVVATVSDANYAGTATGTLVISALTTPTLSFNIPTHTYNDPDFNVTATSNSSGTITYTYVSGPATLSGNTLHLTGAGSVSIMASQAANGSFSSATKTATFTVNKATAAVTLGNLNAIYDGNPHAATATTTPAGLNTTITYAGSATPPSAIGNYQVTATVNDANYTGTGTGQLSISSLPAPALDFSIPTHTFRDPDFAVAATSNSTGAITYSLISGPAMLSGNTVHLTGAGSVTIMASQVASSSYAATTKTATFTVNKAAATVTLSNLTATFDNNPHAAAVTTTPAGLNTTTTYNGSVTAPTAAGNYNVVATVNEANYTGSATGTLVINALTTPVLNLTISTHTFGDPGFNVTATSNSPGAISYIYISGPATLSGNTVLLTGAGNVTLQASQAASSTFAATTKSITFAVNKATPVLHWATPAAIAYGATIGAAQLNATATGVNNTTLAGSFVYTPPSGSIANQLPTETLQVAFTPNDATNYTSASTSVTLPVAASILDVTANNATRVYGATNPAFTGAITGQQNGDTFTETFSTIATQTSNAGSFAITPAAVGTNAGRYTQRIHSGTLTITRANVLATSAASVTSAQGNQNVLLTATIATSTTGTPTGNVTFFDNGTIIGTPSLNGTQALLNTSFNTVGAHVITMTYSGDVNFVPASTTQTVTVAAATVQDFTLTLLSSPTTSLSVGDQGSYQLRVSPPAGQTFAANVSLRYSGDLPVYASGQFSVDTVKAGSASTDVTFKFVTMKLSRIEKLRRGGAAIAAAMLLPLCLLRRRRALRGIALASIAFVTLVASTLITGCGTGYPAGVIPVDIIAQSGGITHSVVIQANILKTNP